MEREVKSGKWDWVCTSARCFQALHFNERLVIWNIRADAADRATSVVVQLVGLQLEIYRMFV